MMAINRLLFKNTDLIRGSIWGKFLLGFYLVLFSFFSIAEASNRWLEISP